MVFLKWSKIFLHIKMDHIISIGDRSGEFEGHLGIISPFNFGPSSHLEMKLSPNKFLISILDLFEEWTLTQSCEII